MAYFLIANLIAITCFTSRARAALDPKAIDDAIVRGKAFVYSQMNADGNWELIAQPKDVFEPPGVTGPHWGGRTCIALWTLLSLGESSSDPKLKRAIEFVKGQFPLTSGYTWAFRAEVLAILPDGPQIRTQRAQAAKLFLGAMRAMEPHRGLFHYSMDGSVPGSDLSVSQLAMLAMWNLQESGEEVPTRFWTEANRAWRASQFPDGSWAYSSAAPRNDADKQATIGMTAAGVATLFLLQDFIPTDGKTDAAIESGITWITQHFDSTFNVQREGNRFTPYTLFTISRVGVASGRRYFGDIDWFDRGAAWALSNQRPDGSWNNPDSNFFFDPLSDACLVMLFLDYGRAPVVVTKLRFKSLDNAKPVEARWNVRPRDVMTATRWMGRQAERRLNFRIASLDRSLSELLESPVLYLSSDAPFDFSPEDVVKLRAYAESGGMIVVNVERKNRRVETATRTLATKLFPDREPRALPASSSIFTRQQFLASKWKRKPVVYGVTNGTREMMLILSDDPAADWTRRSTRTESLELFANAIQYATASTYATGAGQTWAIVRDTGKPASQRMLKLARIRYAGNWDPEPGGFRRLADALHNAGTLELSISEIKLAANSLEGFGVAHLTGTDQLKLSAPEKLELKRFIVGGGLLIVDAAGGSAEFAISVEQLLRELNPDDAAAEATIASDPAFAPDRPLPKPLYREFARTTLSGDFDQPRLQTWKLSGRPAVIYSREDLTVGLVGMPIDGIIGYEPAAASEIMTRLLLGAIDRR